MKELINIQSELKAPKSQYNSFGKYQYRNAEDILEAVKPLLKKNNCHLTITDEIILIGDRYYVKATAEITNGTEVVVTSALAREEESKKGMDSAQLTGATSSYARKYALNGLFCIDDTKDSDYNNQGDKGGQESAKQVPTPTKEVKQAPNVPPIPEEVLKEIAEAQTNDDINKLWKKYVNLRVNPDFKPKLTTRNDEIKNSNGN
jgi:hypothetical protein